MKNKIVYGVPGSGKTSKYFNPTIENWEGKTIAVSLKTEKEFKGFKVFPIDNPNISFEEVFSYDKVLLLFNSKCDSFWNYKGLKNMVTYMLENSDNFKVPVLLAIDDFYNFNLSEKFSNGESLILNLLNLNSLTTLFVVQNLKEIAEQYKEDYDKIMSLCEVISTKGYEEYSGELRVRFPKSLHKDLKLRADIEGVSLNQYIIYELTKAIENKNVEVGKGMNFYYKNMLMYEIMKMRKSGIPIVVIDSEDEYKKLAEQLGADGVYNETEDTNKQVIIEEHNKVVID